MNHPTRMLGAVCAAGALLVGCGGGDDNKGTTSAPEPLSAVPDSAGASSAGLMSYLKQLIGADAAAAERAEPAGVDRFGPPQPDDTEPESVS